MYMLSGNKSEQVSLPPYLNSTDKSTKSDITDDAWTGAVIFNVGGVGRACFHIEMASAAVSLSIGATDWIGSGTIRLADTRRLILFIQGAYSTWWTIDFRTGQT